MKWTRQIFFFFLTTLITRAHSMTQQYAGTVTAISSDGRLIALANNPAHAAAGTTQTPIAAVYTSHTGQQLFVVNERIISFSAHAHMFCTFDGNNKIKVYEQITGKVIKEFPGIYAKFIGDVLLVGLSQTEGEVYSTIDWEMVHKLSMVLTEKTIDSLMSPFMPNTGKLLAQVTKGQLTAYDISTGFVIWHGAGIDGYFSADGNKIGIDSVPSEYPAIDIYAINTGQQLCRILGSSALFSPDTRSIAAGKYSEQEHKTTIYDTTTGLPQHTYNGELLQFSPDGTKAIMSIEGDGKYTFDSIHLFDLCSERTIQEFDDETNVNFLPNGRLCIQKEGTAQIGNQTP